jgi:hypothetical protein
MSLILLNLAGGDCVDDLSLLQGDPGFAELMHRVETHGIALQASNFWRRGAELEAASGRRCLAQARERVQTILCLIRLCHK